MQFAPNHEFLLQLLQLLRSSVGASNERHGEIATLLGNYGHMKDYNAHLVFVLCKCANENEAVRATAGFLLKNNMRNLSRDDASSVEFIKETLLNHIGEPSVLIRKTIGSTISNLLNCLSSFNNWPNLLISLNQSLSSKDPNVIHGSISCLSKVLEDSNDFLYYGDPDVTAALNSLIPKLLAFLASDYEVFKLHALMCIFQLLLVQPPALRANIDTFVHGLFHLAVDPSAEIRKFVCQTLVTLWEIQPECLMPNLPQIVEYMLDRTCEKETSIAIEACEFWASLAESDGGPSLQLLRDVLPRLLPILVSNLVYSLDELIRLGGDDDIADGTVPDKLSDIKPLLSKSKMHGGHSSHDDTTQQYLRQDINANMVSKDKNGHAKKDDDDDEDEDDDNNNNGDDEDEEDDEDEGDGDYDDHAVVWTMRKSAAAALDVIANVFHADILNILIPLIKERIDARQRWDVRESGILALGCVSEGCFEGLKPHLPLLIPFLIVQTADQKPLVRSMACWTLQRYSSWIASSPEGKQHFFDSTITCLCERVLDYNKKVQKAASLALSGFLHKIINSGSNELLTPHIVKIVNCLVSAFNSYQIRNLIVLCETITVFSDSVGSKLNDSHISRYFLTPFVARINDMHSSDGLLLYIMETVTALVTALGDSIQPFAVFLFEKSLCYVSELLVNVKIDADADRQLAVCGIDLICAICESLPSNVFSYFINEPKYRLLEILIECLNDDVSTDLKQSAFGFLGDLVKSQPQIMNQNFLTIVFPLSIGSMLHAISIPMCNNAIWAIGRIIGNLTQLEDVAPYALNIIQNLAPIMNKLSLNPRLLENCAITIGAVSFACPSIIAPFLDVFLNCWCITLRSLEDEEERLQSYRGLLALIKLNSQATMGSFVYVCDAIVSWKNPPAFIDNEFRTVLQSYKASVDSSQWQNYFNVAFPPALKNSLITRYQL